MWFQCISDIFLMSGMGRGGMLEVVFDSGVLMQWRRRNMGRMGNRRRPERNELSPIVCRVGKDVKQQERSSWSSYWS